MAIYGPAGCGKSLTSLLIAREIVGPKGKIAVLDTEHGSSTKHARKVRFDVEMLTGARPDEVPGAVRAGGWWVGEGLDDLVAGAVGRTLERFHREHPLREGADLALVREAAGEALERAGGRPDAGLIDALLDLYAARGLVVRSASEIRLATHQVTADQGHEDIDRLVKTIEAGEPTPPTIAELVASGITREIVDAAVRRGIVVKASPDLVFTAAFVDRAREALRELSGDGGISVSAFRERIGTSRKYAVPLLEHFDQKGVTRRQGDLRFVRS